MDGAVCRYTTSGGSICVYNFLLISICVNYLPRNPKKSNLANLPVIDYLLQYTFFISSVSVGIFCIFNFILQYIPRNMHTVFALLCFVVVIHWLIFPYPSGLLHWHCGNLTIAPVPAKQPWWIWINTSCEFIMNDCITTTKQSTTKPCAYFLGYSTHQRRLYASVN